MWLVKVLITTDWKIQGEEIVQMYAPGEIIFWSCGTITLHRVVSLGWPMAMPQQFYEMVVYDVSVMVEERLN